MSILPVLNINQFDFSEISGSLYANIFSDHLRTYHASITKPHKHDFYLVVLFLQGSGTHEVDFTAYPIKPGSIFLLRPGQTHHWELSADIDGYIFFHTGEFYNLLFPNKRIDDYPAFFTNYNSPYIQLSEGEIETYTARFKMIYEEYSDDLWLKEQRMALLIDLTYIDLARLYTAENESFKNPEVKNMVWLSKLEGLVDKYYIEKKHPTDYATALNISVKHLNKIVMNTLGKTTSDLIHDRILLEAKRMLTHGQSSVQEIAFELGYEDPSYFSRFFKKKVGVVPSEFAEKYIT